MFNRLRSKTASESGFTLVELLVVMLILGLLAGIGIPAFLSQREKARDVDAKHAAGIAGRAAETVAVNNQGAYDGPGGVTVVSLKAVEETLNEANLTVLAVGPRNFSIRVTASGGHTFDYTRDAAGAITTACAPVGEGGCPEDGTWD
jgi:prepilin-type N-terminal cleavage/methylation domain-containing protein